jgi:hypothetical protein
MSQKIGYLVTIGQTHVSLQDNNLGLFLFSMQPPGPPKICRVIALGQDLKPLQDSKGREVRLAVPWSHLIIIACANN